MDETLAALPAAFAPLFVATDVFGMLPIFIFMTDGMSHRERTRVAAEAAVTAFAASALFALTGGGLFMLLGVASGYLELSVGAILLAVAVLTLLGKRRRHKPSARVGIVPLGVPLIAGPAVLTTVIFLIEHYGAAPTLLSLALNMTILFAVFYGADTVVEHMGQKRIKTLSKAVAVLLIIVALTMIYLGFVEVFGESI